VVFAGFLIASLMGPLRAGLTRNVRAYVHPGKHLQCSNSVLPQPKKKAILSKRSIAKSDQSELLNIAVGGQVGGGRWGTVYAGKEETNGNDYALKMDQKLRKFWDSEDAFGGRFQDLWHECGLLNELHNEHGLKGVPRCHAVCSAKGRDVLVMDLIKDGAHSNEKAWSKLPIDKISQAVESVVWHLVTMVRANIVNVDQRFVNILLTSNGTVHFIDMGLALRRSELDSQCSRSFDDAVNGTGHAAQCHETLPVEEQWQQLVEKFIATTLGALPRLPHIIKALPGAFMKMQLSGEPHLIKLFRNALLQLFPSDSAIGAWVNAIDRPLLYA